MQLPGAEQATSPIWTAAPAPLMAFVGSGAVAGAQVLPESVSSRPRRRVMLVGFWYVPTAVHWLGAGHATEFRAEAGPAPGGRGAAVACQDPAASVSMSPCFVVVPLV